MKQEQQLRLLNQWFEEERKLAIDKGHDYATEDVLANFRRMHRACQIYDINPSERIMDVYLFYMLIKFDRICNLVHSDKEPRNESLQDSFADHRMYNNLARMELIDEGAAEFDAEVDAEVEEGTMARKFVERELAKHNEAIAAKQIKMASEGIVPWPWERDERLHSEETVEEAGWNPPPPPAEVLDVS